MSLSTAMANAVILTGLTACFPQLVKPYQKNQQRRPAALTSLDVKPSTEVDNRVADEVAKAGQILKGLDMNNFLSSPYLVSAIYYHDNFLADFPINRSSADPERRIIGQISSILSADLKERFVRLLHELWERTKPSARRQFVDPVEDTAPVGGRRSHKNAIDLFAAQGAAVHSVSRGVVILADQNWSPDLLFSSTSRKGGNAVIVFNPDEDRFYRYCHLNRVLVTCGQVVVSGQTIGSVGHTGLNASQPGHGQHLHFEVNEYLDGHVRAIDSRRLRTMLRQWQASPRLKSPQAAHVLGSAVQ